MDEGKKLFVNQEWKKRAQEEKEELIQGKSSSKQDSVADSSLRGNAIPHSTYGGFSTNPSPLQGEREQGHWNDTKESANNPGKEESATGFTNAQGEPQAIPEYPLPDFIGFVSGLAAQVLAALGEIDDPLIKKGELDLRLAQYTIDILLMLQDKTKGNLSADEEQILKEVIHRLQLLFVQVSQGGKSRS